VEPTERQWVAYRVVPGAMLAAPLPSAPEVGDGWRGVDLRRVLPLDQLDPLVIDTATKSESALGVHVEASFAYVVAASRDAEPVRLVLGVDASSADERAEAAITRAGATGAGARWRKRAAKAIEAWSSQAPRPADATTVLALMGPEHPPAEAVSWLCALLGIAAPNEPIPDPLDLQSVARRQLEDGSGEPAKRRWFSRGD
jgi:hypothetical protein